MRILLLNTLRAASAGMLPLVLIGCAMTPTQTVPQSEATQSEATPMLVTTHRDHDDLLTAGLGRSGLLGAVPALADPAAPTAAELRKRAIYASWRGIVDLVGTVTAIPVVPGREFASLRTVAGARFPHRVLAQIPDNFNADTPCLIVTASSGSRGIYGAIGSVGDYALRRGCAVVYTDKGAGTDWFNPRTGQGTAVDGTVSDAAANVFRPVATASDLVAIKHAHSQDLPEADWGQHVLQAAQFGLDALNQAFPDHGGFDRRNTRVVAFGLSNGAAAVLRAGEQDQDGLLDAVVAAAPNVQIAEQPALFDYALEAAILQPCALLQGDAPAFLPDAAWKPKAEQRCRSLRQLGWISGDDIAAQAASATERLNAFGFSAEAMHWAGMNLAFDLWRSVLAAYAQTYARAGVDAPVCDYRFAVLDASGQPRAVTPAEQALWWSDASGLAPSAGVQIIDGLATGDDPNLPGLLCLHRLRHEGMREAQGLVLQQSLQSIRATARPKVPTLIVHGEQDALIPIAFTSAPYVAAARTRGVANLAFWRVPNAQHFDAFLALPVMAGKAKPLLPEAHQAMDAMRAYLDGGAFPTDR
ncbi:3-hydroxybutyrate oligomer hydrolase family protein [Ahniella affigens]|nr:3-hydroxybutyrate oligomer hydrolase family protein [Ahniella affigens]